MTCIMVHCRRYMFVVSPIAFVVLLKERRYRVKQWQSFCGRQHPAQVRFMWCARRCTQGSGHIHAPRWSAECLVPPSPSTIRRKQQVADGKVIGSPSVKTMRLHYILFIHVEKLGLIPNNWSQPLLIFVVLMKKQHVR